eukprot:NODE_4671_length_756_cov_5.841017_g4511_i0.p1 GENE.NODE_4671_length_756_cov_5.841017_g4511_i0~~NODE_4671_length_756_cov_5.841017_g4511_i0.p1  ORF type:complete len:103 (-),score=27.89 NODE_4671_length_756_cov_5.841017_g4511_i0:30-338(-)
MQEDELWIGIFTSCLGLMEKGLKLNPSLHNGLFLMYLQVLTTEKPARPIALTFVARLFPYAKQYKRPLLQALWQLCCLPESHEFTHLRRASNQFLKKLICPV